MTIKYADGRAVEGIILSRTDDTMRVAISEGDDAVMFTWVGGTWISENCEPVEIQFEWQRRAPQKPVSEADCICSKELVGRLVQRLFGGNEVEGTATVVLKRLRAGTRSGQNVPAFGNGDTAEPDLRRCQLLLKQHPPPFPGCNAGPGLHSTH
jgi:hypothetical protein